MYTFNDLHSESQIKAPLALGFPPISAPIRRKKDRFCILVVYDLFKST